MLLDQELHPEQRERRSIAPVTRFADEIQAALGGSPTLQPQVEQPRRSKPRAETAAIPPISHVPVQREPRYARSVMARSDHF